MTKQKGLTNQIEVLRPPRLVSTVGTDVETIIDRSINEFLLRFDLYLDTKLLIQMSKVATSIDKAIPITNNVDHSMDILLGLEIYSVDINI